MKLLFMMLSSIILAKSTNSQQKAGSYVPQTAIAAFSTKYPAAQAVTWKVAKDDIEVSFKNDDKKYYAFYTTAGDWIKTERKIKWPKGLPAAVKKSLQTGDYAAWYVDEMKEVETQGQHVYLIHVDDANVLKIADPYLFKDDYQLYYNEDGELIKKEKLP